MQEQGLDALIITGANVANPCLDQEPFWKPLMDILQMFLRLVNIRDVKSLAAHPASTTHRQLSGAELESAGVTPDMIRLCIGIEDIIADLEQALAAA